MITNLQTTIDAYAALKAEIGKLETQKKALEAALAELSPGAYESDKFRLSISESTRESPDAELKAEIDDVVAAYRAKLSRQYLTAHTVVTAVRSHRVGLPTGKNLAA